MKKFIIISILALTLAACATSQSAVETAVSETMSAQLREKQHVDQEVVAEPTNTQEIVIDKKGTAQANSATRTAEYILTPSITYSPTSTPEPTNTPIPSNTPTPTRSAEELRPEFLALIIEFLENGEGLEDVGNVNLVRFGDPGVLEIEVNSRYSSKSNQPQLSYAIIRFLSVVLIEGIDYENLKMLSSGENFGINLTTYSEENRYRYQSFTTYELLQKVHDKVISYDEWVVESGAGFK